MLLCIDIGNTNVVMGLFEGDRLIGQARFATSNLKTADECGIQASHLVQMCHPLKQVEVDGVAISSVVPALTPWMIEMSRRYLSKEPVVVNSDLDMGLVLMVHNPREIGADRLANAVAAIKLYQGDCLIIDLGTATTFDVISGKGEYLGGAIAPGLETAAANLAQRAAQLFSVEITPPKNVIGKSTEECMKSGIFWGQVEMLNGMIVRIEEEYQAECTIVITGGYGKILSQYIDREVVYNPDLTLIGLKLIYDGAR
jgi:type III pantothenate kinase